MNAGQTRFLFLNVGHFLTHLFMLLYPTVVLALVIKMERPYSELLAYSLVGFIAYGAGALPAGWLADRFGRKGVLAVFFVGIGIASILTGFADTPLEIGIGLAFIGLFASIYHPVGIAMVVEGRDKVGKALGLNGVWGNMGVALAPLIAGAITESIGWRYAFIIPGVISLVFGALFIALVRGGPPTHAVRAGKGGSDGERLRIPIGILAMLAIGALGSGLVFNTMTVSMPALFNHGLSFLEGSVTRIGLVITIISAVAAFTQIGVGLLVDRFPIRPIWLAICLIEAPLLALTGVLVDASLLIVTIPLVFLVLGEIPIQDALVARYTTEAWRARVYAMKFVLAISISAVTVPMIALLQGSTGDFSGVYAVLAGVAVMVALAAAMFTRGVRTHDRAAPNAQPAE